MSDEDNLDIFSEREDDEGQNNNNGDAKYGSNEYAEDYDEEDQQNNNNNQQQNIDDDDADLNIDNLDDEINQLIDGDEEDGDYNINNNINQGTSKRRGSNPTKKRKSSSGDNGEPRQPKKSSKREQDLKLIRERISKEVNEIKTEMEKIHSRDVKAVKENKPALNKIKNVDNIIVKLSKQGVQKEFIQDKGLDYLTNWLDKIPNGPEPSVSLRKKLLQFIYELPVQRHHFQGIRLGKVIYKISSKSEVKELRVLANKVVEKWSKILKSRDRMDDEYNDDDNN